MVLHISHHEVSTTFQIKHQVYKSYTAERWAFPGKPRVDAAALGMKASLFDQRTEAGSCGTLFSCLLG